MVVAGLGIRTYVVWIPILDRDESVSVPNATKYVGVTPQYFDGEKKVGDGLAKAFGLVEPVWDSFFFYAPGATWTATGLPFPAAAVAQEGGVVIGTHGSLPPAADQSKLARELRAKWVVVGEQKDLASILSRVAQPFRVKPAR